MTENMIYNDNLIEAIPYEEWKAGITNEALEPILQSAYKNFIEYKVSEDRTKLYNIFRNILKKTNMVMYGQTIKKEGACESGHVFTKFEEIYKLIHKDYDCIIKAYYEYGSLIISELNQNISPAPSVYIFRVMTAKGLREWYNHPVCEDLVDNMVTIKRFYFSEDLVREVSESEIAMSTEI